MLLVCHFSGRFHFLCLACVQQSAPIVLSIPHPECRHYLPCHADAPCHYQRGCVLDSLGKNKMQQIWAFACCPQRNQFINRGPIITEVRNEADLLVLVYLILTGLEFSPLDGPYSV